MKVDFKVMTWERVEVPDDLKELVLEKIQAGDIRTSNELFIYLTDECGVDPEYCILPDVDTATMSLEENDGYSTIEVLEGEETIYENGL